LEARPSVKQHANVISATGDVLAVVLYRFGHALDRSGNFSPIKVTRKVAFPTEITLETGRYRLFGVVSHLGSRLSSGHYVAAVRGRRDDVWYECNDGWVTPLQIKALYDGRAITSTRPDAEPYILFYHRQSANASAGDEAGTSLGKAPARTAAAKGCVSEADVSADSMTRVSIAASDIRESNIDDLLPDTRDVERKAKGEMTTADSIARGGAEDLMVDVKAALQTAADPEVAKKIHTQEDTVANSALLEACTELRANEQECAGVAVTASGVATKGMEATTPSSDVAAGEGGADIEVGGVAHDISSLASKDDDISATIASEAHDDMDVNFAAKVGGADVEVGGVAHDICSLASKDDDISATIASEAYDDMDVNFAAKVGEDVVAENIVLDISEPAKAGMKPERDAATCLEPADPESDIEMVDASGEAAAGHVFSKADADLGANSIVKLGKVSRRIRRSGRRLRGGQPRLRTRFRSPARWSLRRGGLCRLRRLARRLATDNVHGGGSAWQ